MSIRSQLWVTSVAVCDRRLRVDFRNAPFATEIARRCNISRWAQHRTSSPTKGLSAQSRKVSTNDLSSHCFSLARECWGKDRRGAVRVELLHRNRHRTQLCYRPPRRPRDSEIPGASDCIEAYASSSHAKLVSLELQGGGHGCGVKGGGILTVITEATFKDRECCHGRDRRCWADDNAPCLLAREILPAQMIQTHAGRLPC